MDKRRLPISIPATLFHMGVPIKHFGSVELVATQAFLPEHYRSRHYIANKMFKQHRTSEIAELLKNSPEDFLKNENYVPVEDTNKGIILYFDKRLNFKPSHIGIWHGEKEIESKWGRGSAYLHPAEMIPKNYGSHFTLFSKQI